ncbi:hypothetical protein [Pseudarthrobacter albicanus]|uniref:hypothetical protein n=1 Tax=Pseudarthrobacter albicanus TaxID=2823873 RepID=UPI001BABC013|nr:hypothetical protein [Pseudarthrobacter albicanus]
MNIKDQWDRLDDATRTWLIDNPGCLVLPRTITATIARETGENAECDPHGQMVLSQEDRDFIQSKANNTRTAAPEYRFFDSTQP